jgi:hypothetical protein
MANLECITIEFIFRIYGAEIGTKVAELRAQSPGRSLTDTLDQVLYEENRAVMDDTDELMDTEVTSTIEPIIDL